MTNTDDLIARLRVNTNPYNYDPRSLLCQYGIERIEAADALTAAQERIEALEKALQGLLEPYEYGSCHFDHHGYCQEHFLQTAEECCVAVARAALTKGDPQ